MGIVAEQFHELYFTDHHEHMVTYASESSSHFKPQMVTAIEQCALWGIGDRVGHGLFKVPFKAVHPEVSGGSDSTESGLLISDLAGPWRTMVQVACMHEEFFYRKGKALRTPG